MKPISYGIIGGGWRAEFYLRIANLLPEQFQVSRIFIRDKDKAQKMEQKWGVPTVSTLGEFMEAVDYSFAVISVPWKVSPEIIIELTKHGIPVLAETPPAPDLAGLIELYETVGPHAKIEVAEQYLFQPMHAARIELARSGKLGNISQVQVSAAHGYHGISLIRQLLGIQYEDATISGLRLLSPVVQGPVRDGLPQNEVMSESIQDIVTLKFGDQVAIYDFNNSQYFSWIRNHRILVRGDRGEITNDEVSYLRDYKTPIFTELRRVDTGLNGNLEGYHHRGVQIGSEWVYTNPFTPGRLSDDEIAVATCLYKMGQYAIGEGTSFYSLAQASQDHYLSLLMGEAIETGQAVISSRQSWAR